MSDEHTCPLCDGDDPYTGSENSVRAHIRATTDESHKGRSGFYTNLETGEHDLDIHDDPPGGHYSKFLDGEADTDGTDTDGSDAGTTRLQVPDIEPDDAGEPDADPDPPAACPTCDTPLGMTEGDVEELADRVREKHGADRSEAVRIGECEVCGTEVAHVHD